MCPYCSGSGEGVDLVAHASGDPRDSYLVPVPCHYCNGDGETARPDCWNRAARHPYYLANAGTSHANWPFSQQVLKPIPIVFVDRCATWDGRGIGPNGEPYPIAHGWDCAGCRWLPAGVTLPVNISTPETSDNE